MPRRLRFTLTLSAGAFCMLALALAAAADTVPSGLPFGQAWTNTGMITTNDDWSGVPSVQGYRGDGLTSSTGVDPQTVLSDGSAVPDVNANQLNPNTFTTGGVTEFELADPVVALQGSGTADAPHLVVTVDTTGADAVNVSYTLRDVDGSADNAVQPVALQYRVGAGGDFTNVPAGFVADATTGPSLATLTTPVNVTLPAGAANQPLVQLRVITTDAAGSDEWVGVDDISVVAAVVPPDDAPEVDSTAPAAGATGVAANANVEVTFSEPVNVTGAWYSIDCAVTHNHAATVSGGPTTFTLDPTSNFLAGESCTVTIAATGVTDQDANDPPDAMAADHAWSFTVFSPPPPGELFSQNWSNTNLITTNDDWSGVPNVVGYLGDGLTSVTDVDPQTVLAEGSGTVDVIANQLSPNTLTTGGVAEFELADPVVALQGSGTADAPHLVISVNTTGVAGVRVAYNLRDIDGSADNAVQQIALQYRIGSSGNYTNVPAAYVADATTGPSQAVLLTPVQVTLPADAGNRPLVQVRIITTNASGSDEWVGVDAIRITDGGIPPEDAAPRVDSTSPADGATDVARDANVSVTFSEPVSVAADWYSISCGASGNHAAAVSSGPTTFTLDPVANFASDELCTVTISANGVTDQDANDPPDTMTADHVFSFRTADVFACGDPATRIHAVQGSGLASPIVGSSATIEGVVVGDFQLTPSEFGGFYVQEEDTDVDADPATSEGIFVFGGGVPVNAGDIVRVRGTVAEFSGLTQLNQVNAVAICSSGAGVQPTAVSLPVGNVSDHERVESMVVSYGQAMTVTEVFGLGRFGEVVLSGIGRLQSPTAVATPGPAAIARLDANNRSRIILDDGNNQQNIDPTRYPTGGLSAENTLRVGDTLDGVTAVMDFRFSNYRLQPLGPISFTSTNPRTPAPAAVGGNLKVASFNVLNYFNGDGAGGGFPTSRGATTPFELERQRTKIINAIQTIDADIVGLMEIENDAPPNSAIEDLVAGLNAAMGAGTYSFIDTGRIGGDEIKVALIYKPGTVTPTGDWEIITSAVDPRFVDTLNRPSLAQTFQHTSTGQKLTVVVNHLKSKGSACPGDPDTGDGSGNCNLTRTNAAAALADWLETDPTGSGDPDFLVIGDLNSYTMETPITTLEAEGFTNLVRQFAGLFAYSFVFQGESGYLDHALGSAPLVDQVTGVTEWHVNPDEPTVLDYNVEFKTPNQVNTFYAPGPYRSSDHDPVVVGLHFNSPPSADAGGPYVVAEGGSVSVNASGTDPDGGPLTYEWDLDDDGDFDDATGQSATFSAAALDGPATRTIRVRVTDDHSLSDVADAVVTIENVAPTATFGAPGSSFAGFAFTLSLTSPTDPSPADVAAGFEYAFDCGSGYGPFGSASSASCPTDSTGSRSVGGKIRDKDGGVSEYRATVTVVVTFDSLCELTTLYAGSDTNAAHSLCVKLRNAAEATEENTRENILRAYRNEVDAKTGSEPGKAFTAEQAAILMQLSLEL